MLISPVPDRQDPPQSVASFCLRAASHLFACPSVRQASTAVIDSSGQTPASTISKVKKEPLDPAKDGCSCMLLDLDGIVGVEICEGLLMSRLPLRLFGRLDATAHGRPPTLVSCSHLGVETAWAAGPSRHLRQQGGDVVLAVSVLTVPLSRQSSHRLACLDQLCRTNPAPAAAKADNPSFSVRGTRSRTALISKTAWTRRQRSSALARVSFMRRAEPPTLKLDGNYRCGGGHPGSDITQK
jgi:hypothetical protein